MQLPRNPSLFPCLTVLGIVLLLAAGCKAAQTSAVPAPTLASAVPSTAEPTSTREPQFLVTATTVSQTIPPMVVLSQPTVQSVLPQQTVTPSTAKPALVQIESPGPGSKVRDFVWVRANVYPGDNGNVNILLTGEDGRVIASRELVYSTWKTGWLSIAEQIEFTPLAASETALLSVFTRDGYGRVIALTSVRLLMLQVGPEEIELPGFHGDPFVLTDPVPSGVSKKGTLHVEGFAHLAQANPVTVELILVDGTILASQQITVNPVLSGKGYTAFSTDVAYQIAQRTPVRITLRQESSEMNSVTTELSSFIIYLDP
jgi:hypothetical protein